MDKLIALFFSFDFIVVLLFVIACILVYRAIKRLSDRVYKLELRVHQMENQLVEMNDDILFYDYENKNVDVNVDENEI